MNLQLICRSWCYQPFKKCWYVCCGQQNHDLTMRLSKRIDRVRYNQMQTSPIASDTSTRLHVLIPSLIYRRKLGNCFMAIVLWQLSYLMSSCGMRNMLPWHGVAEIAP
jgi:hypothetical protein